MQKKPLNITMLLMFTFFMLVSLACNFPTLLNSNSQTGDNLISSTETAEELKDNIQSLLENSKSGDPFHLVINESQLNALINQELQTFPDYDVQDVQVSLANGQIDVTGRVDQGGIKLPLTAVMTLSATSEGLPYYQVNSAAVGPFEIPQSLTSDLASNLDAAFMAQFLPAADRAFIKTISIDNGQMIIDGHIR